MRTPLLAMMVATNVMVLAATPGLAQKFVGTGKCKVCHAKDETGNQYGKWASTKHAKAYATLQTDAARTAAKKVGVSDPAHDMKCPSAIPRAPRRARGTAPP